MLPIPSRTDIIPQHDQPLKITKYGLQLLIEIITGHSLLNKHLSHWHNITDKRCRLCKEEEETYHHLIYECLFIFHMCAGYFDRYKAQNNPRKYEYLKCNQDKTRLVNVRQKYSDEGVALVRVLFHLLLKLILVSNCCAKTFVPVIFQTRPIAVRRSAE